MQKQLLLLSCNIYVLDVGTHLTFCSDMRNAHKYTYNIDVIPRVQGDKEDREQDNC